FFSTGDIHKRVSTDRRYRGGIGQPSVSSVDQMAIRNAQAHPKTTFVVLLV
ncbi:MAG: hypothetical protein QOI13_124, partial [Paraburkholderia sp.]|nr:hypothetical protein [Paraburkholderia sp.]